MRQLRSTARQVLLGLTAACVVAALALNSGGWPELPTAALLAAAMGGGSGDAAEPAELLCPADSIRVDDRCVATAVECPAGSARIEGRCVALEVDCPEYSVRLGQRCVATTHTALYSGAERLACSPAGVGCVYTFFFSLAGVAALVAWRRRPKPRRYRCLQDAAMTADRDFLPAHYGNMATLQTVGHIKQGEIVTVRRVDTSRPTQQRRAQLDNGYWVSLVSQSGERLFQPIHDAEAAAEAAATAAAGGSAGSSHAGDDGWEEGGGSGGGISLFATYPAGVCHIRLHAHDAPSGQHRLAARRATFGARVGNLFGATCVLPRARHAELELDPLVVVSADGRRSRAVVAVVYRCRFVPCVEQARRVQAAGAAGLILVDEDEAQAVPDWRNCVFAGIGSGTWLRAPWSRTAEGFPGDVTIPVMCVDPADGELLARAILRAEEHNNPEASMVSHSASFMRDMLLGGDRTENISRREQGQSVAQVDMLEIPPKLRLHPRYRREWRLAPGSSLQLERADASDAAEDEAEDDGDHFLDAEDDDLFDQDGYDAGGSLQGGGGGGRRYSSRGESVGVSFNLG